MHIPRWFLWLLLYTGATFCWIVYFEYGAGGEKFKRGAEKEWSRVQKALQAWFSARP